MKKKIAIMLIGLMCVSAVGCSKMNGGIDLSALNTADFFADISEDSNVDGEAAAEKFTAAIDDMNNSDNITIKTVNQITMGTEGQDDYQDSINDTKLKLAMDGESQTGSVVISNVYKSSDDEGNPVEEKTNISGYYTDNKLYFLTGEGDKVMEEMGFDNFMTVVNTYSISLYKDCISRAAEIENKNGKTCYISYDPSSFETTMNTNMEASGQTLNDGEAMHVNFANIIVEYDSEDNLKGYGFLINAEYVNDNETMPYSYSIITNVENKGSTKVDVVEDTDDYMTADEYTQMLQQRVLEAEEAMGSELVTDEGGAAAGDETADDAGAENAQQ